MRQRICHCDDGSGKDGDGGSGKDGGCHGDEEGEDKDWV